MSNLADCHSEKIILVRHAHAHPARAQPLAPVDTLQGPRTVLKKIPVPAGRAPVSDPGPAYLGPKTRCSRGRIDNANPPVHLGPPGCNLLPQVGHAAWLGDTWPMPTLVDEALWPIPRIPIIGEHPRRQEAAENASRHETRRVEPGRLSFQSLLSPPALLGSGSLPGDWASIALACASHPKVDAACLTAGPTKTPSIESTLHPLPLTTPQSNEMRPPF